MPVKRVSQSTLLRVGSANFSGAWAVKTTGGTSQVAGGYVIHSFISTGNSTFTVASIQTGILLPSGLTAEVMIIAGGGAGGSNAGGGGGAGGYYYGNIALSVTSYALTVGAGGPFSGNHPNTSAPAGGNSTGFGITRTGGGGGGWGGSNAAPGGSGGSGGGGASWGGYWPNSGGSGVSGEGSSGGAATSGGQQQFICGGGGGVAGSGVTADLNTASGTNGYKGALGGAGTTNTISGASVSRAGGGSGSGNTNASTGGTAWATNGASNTGAGGGGGGFDGGSGIIVVRYPL